MQSGMGFAAALSICVFPFIPGDLAKMLIVIAIAPQIRRRLDMAGKA